MNATCLNCSLILENIGAPPEADEFMHLLCEPPLDPAMEKETPRRAGRVEGGVIGSRPAPG